MCEKAVDIYLSSLLHVSNCSKTQKMSEKAVDTCPFMLDFAHNCYKTQEVCKKLFLNNLLC